MQRSILYKSIRDIVREKLPWIQYVDLQKGQFQKPAEHYPIPLPALLVEYADTRYSNVLRSAQLGESNITLWLYLPCVTDSFDGAELEDETLQLLDKADSLYQALHGELAGGYMLTRITDYKPVFDNNTVCFRCDYAITLKDTKVDTIQHVERPPIKIVTRNV